MKKLVLVRLGGTPNPQVTAALLPHMAPNPVAFPIPGAIVSVFETQSSIDEVSQAVKETGSLFFLMDMESAKINLPEEVMELVGLAEQPQAQPQTAEQTVDEILDLIREHGVGVLTEEQKRILEQGL